MKQRHGGNQRHSHEKIAAALERVKRGENPFRAARQMGLARTTLIHHLEKQPNEFFASGVNPIVSHIYNQIEVILWKAKLRLAKNIFRQSAKLEAKTSSSVMKDLNDSPVQPPVMASMMKCPQADGVSVSDKLTFEKFVITRTREAAPKSEEPKEDLGDPSLDSLAEQNVGLPMDGKPAPKEG